MILITVPLPGRGIRNLSRPQTELLAKTLARVRSAAAAQAQGKRGRDSAASPAPAVRVALLDANGALICEENTSNVEAWLPGCTLLVGDIRLPVRVNAPTVSALWLLERPMSGCPIMPLPLELRFCHPEALRWRWERGGTALSDEQRYTPVEEDVGHQLTVRCFAPGCDCGVEANTQPVAAAVSRPDAARRAASLGKRTEGTLRVMTYNLLADAYAHTWRAIYPYLAERDAAACYRMQLALQDVVQSDADVLALQECDLKAFKRFWQPQLSFLGYAGRHTSKSSSVGEGCALFWRTSALTRLEIHDVDLRMAGLPDVTSRLPGAPEALRAMLEAQPALVIALARVTTVGQVALFKPSDGTLPHVLLANTHLFYHPGAAHIRCLQAHALLRRCAEVAHHHGQTNDEGPPLALVLCGDLNAEPCDGALEYLTRGYLGSSHPDWNAGQTFAFERAVAPPQDAPAAPADARTSSVPPAAQLPRDSLGFGMACDANGAALVHPFGRLSNGCGAPPWTNFVGGFKAVLDYVLISGQLEAVGCWPSPSLEAVSAQTALPNAQFPSDHLPQVCDLRRAA